MEKPDDIKVILLMHFLDNAFYKIELQKSRIDADKRSMNTKNLFPDIHFLLIAFCNLNKLLKNLCSHFKNPNLNTIFTKYEKALTHLNDFRDHLEHITEGRLDGKGQRGKKLTNPNMLGDLYGDTYHFGGETFNLKDSFTFSSNLKMELENWDNTSNEYPFWN